MLKKTITYEDIDGKEVSEDFYFNFTMAELMEEMLVSPNDDLEGRFRKMLENDDRPAIMNEFKKLISTSVGQRTAEGKFVKSPEFARAFMSSEAYSELFQELMTNTDAMSAFVNGVMPRKLREQAAAAAGREATVIELPNSGVIEGVAGDAAVQAEKPQPKFEFASTPFPQTTEAAIRANQRAQAESIGMTNPASESDEPPWLREMRSPTRQEMMKMSKEELQLVFKMKEAGVLS